MTRTLAAGQNIALADLNPALTDVMLGFGWDILQPRGPQVELVPAAIALGEDGRVVAPDAFAFHNQLAVADKALTVVGDDSTQFDIDLDRVPAAITRIVFVVFADPDVRTKASFDTVQRAHLRIADRQGAELARFDLPRLKRGMTAANFGELYRHRGAWKFRAIGEGYRDGLTDISAAFGIAL